jgi:hypothetical protein
MKKILLGFWIALGLSCNEPQPTTSICAELINERSICVNRLYNASSTIDQNNMKEQIIRLDTMLIKCNCNNQVDIQPKDTLKPVQ